MSRLTTPIHLLAGLAAAGLLVATPPARAADVAAGKAKAAACALCHGKLGVAMMPNAPNLAGQVPSYVEEQLRNFRSGKRQNEVMSVIAKPLSDTDIENLAAWYGAIRVEVSEPK